MTPSPPHKAPTPTTAHSQAFSTPPAHIATSSASHATQTTKTNPPQRKPATPQKLKELGISSSGTDPATLIRSLRQHVTFRKGGVLRTLAVDEENFLILTDLLTTAIDALSSDYKQLHQENATNVCRIADLEAGSTKFSPPNSQPQTASKADLEALENRIAALIRRSSLPTDPTSSQASNDVHNPKSYADAAKSLPPANKKPIIPDERKAHQLIVKVSKVDKNHPIHTADPATLCNMLHNALQSSSGITNILDPFYPKSARRLKSSDIVFQFRESHEAEAAHADAAEWLPHLAPNAWSHIPKYQVVLNGCPTNIDPTSEDFIRELENQNDDYIQALSINDARWMQKKGPAEGKTASSVILSFKNPHDADKAIKLGLSLNARALTTHKLTSQPIQCFKCQKYGHLSKVCRAKSPACGLCTGPHDTNSCQSTHARGKPCNTPTCSHVEPKCSNCNGQHPAFFKDCPVRKAERERIAALPANCSQFFNAPTNTMAPLMPSFFV